MNYDNPHSLFSLKNGFEPTSDRNEDVLLYNTVRDSRFPSDFLGKYHIHIICRKGKATFRFAGRSFNVETDDFVIWQMSSEIHDVMYSADFEADFLLVSLLFLGKYNPEMIWAIKGFVFIKINPVFHLTPIEREICDSDFEQFRIRLGGKHLFREDVIGRVLQIFLFDLWDIYSREISNYSVSGNSSSLFLRFNDLLEKYVRTEREIGFYADRLCVSAKYLSEVCRKVSNISASEWISYYSRYELMKMLDNPKFTISQICDEMKFGTQSHFSRYFKRLMGMSPSEYRAKRKND